MYPDSFEMLFRVVRIRVEEEHDTSREGSMLGSGRGRGRGNWRPWTGDGALDMAKASCRGECQMGEVHKRRQNLVHLIPDTKFQASARSSISRRRVFSPAFSKHSFTTLC